MTRPNGSRATLYVIPGSHACRSAILMLEHKQLPYRRVDFVTALHPLAVRLRGFRASPDKLRVAGSRRPLLLRVADRLGTVPALALDGRRVQTNRDIARFLEEHQPEPPLFPVDDAEQRRALEEAERWGNDTLQMAARRITLAGVLHGPWAFARLGGDSRMGHLLYKRTLPRFVILPGIGRLAFAVSRKAERELLADLPAMLDRIDAWIADGVLNGERLNAADFMIAPSLALMLVRRDLDSHFEGRPAKDLADRLLPEPAGA